METSNNRVKTKNIAWYCQIINKTKCFRMFMIVAVVGVNGKKSWTLFRQCLHVLPGSVWDAPVQFGFFRQSKDMQSGQLEIPKLSCVWLCFSLYPCTSHRVCPIVTLNRAELWQN